jgi:hypothetical protein
MGLIRPRLKGLKGLTRLLKALKGRFTHHLECQGMDAAGNLLRNDAPDWPSCRTWRRDVVEDLINSGLGHWPYKGWARTNHYVSTQAATQECFDGLTI